MLLLLKWLEFSTLGSERLDLSLISIICKLIGLKIFKMPLKINFKTYISYLKKDKAENPDDRTASSYPLLKYTFDESAISVF